jgi:hypothetical protein
MAKKVTWFKRHPVWTALIALLALIVLTYIECLYSKGYKTITICKAGDYLRLIIKHYAQQLLMIR